MANPGLDNLDSKVSVSDVEEEVAEILPDHSPSLPASAPAVS